MSYSVSLLFVFKPSSTLPKSKDDLLYLKCLDMLKQLKTCRGGGSSALSHPRERCQAFHSFRSVVVITFA